jgi:hypothetical protein
MKKGMLRLFLAIAMVTMLLPACLKKSIAPCPIDVDCIPVDPDDPGGPPPPPPPDPNTQYITYRGIRPDDPGGMQPLDNPERGFRFYYSMYASNLTQPFWQTSYSGNLSSYIDGDEANYGNNKVRLTLINFYLTEYLHTDISATALANMQQVFDQIKSRGHKVILRFIYRAFDHNEYEELGDISRHLAQLSGFLNQHEPLIHVVQAGFVGLWGEWHSTGLEGWPLEQKVVIRKLLAAVPASRKIQVRETAFKNNAAGAFSGFIHYTYNGGGNSGYESYPALTQEQLDRIGFHNDYFILETGTSQEVGWDFAWPHADFFQVQTEGSRTTVDGEMPNDEYTRLPYGSLGGWYAGRRMRAHAYTSFNIMANYNRNLAAWQNQWVYPSQFRNDNTLVTDDYFVNQSGQETGRIAFQYIRDHLGYRFQLRSGEIPAVVAVNATATFKFRVKNFGFSKMINSRPVHLVLIDANNNVREIATGYNARDWYPTYSQYDGVHEMIQPVYIDNSYVPGHYRVGLWLPDASNDLKYNTAYSVKLANGNMEWWKDAANRYLVNIVGAFDIN